MPKLFRAAALAMAVQQARKFSQTPRGQELIAQAKQAASDPQARAQLINQAKARAGFGGASGGQPGAADPYPPSTRPLSSPSVASPGPATASSATRDMPQVGSIPPPPSVPSDPTRMPPV